MTMSHIVHHIIHFSSKSFEFSARYCPPQKPDHIYSKPVKLKQILTKIESNFLRRRLVSNFQAVTAINKHEKVAKGFLIILS